MANTDIMLAMASLRSSKIRSFLTMVAIIVGVTGFVLVTSFVDGLKGSLTSEIENMGGNLINISSGNIAVFDESGEVTGFNPLSAFGGTSTLTEKDLSDIRETEGVAAAAPQMIISMSGSVKRADTQFDRVIVIATNQDYPGALGQNITAGRFFSDNDSNNRVAVLGASLAGEMFAGGFGLGAQIEIRQQKFTVIGIMEEMEMSASSMFGADFNRMVMIPLERGKAFNAGAINISEIHAQAEEDSDISEVAAMVDAVLLQNHGGERDFTVLKQDQLIAMTSGLLNQLKTASQAITYIMLMVGGVVISLIMLITVKERTREIGVRKSIGATRGNIMMQFLVESVVISWVGSVIGIFVAMAVGLYLSTTSSLSPVYTLNMLFSVVIISTLIGALSGLVPATIAARKDPVEALRDE